MINNEEDILTFQETPFLGKFMVPQMYEIFKFGGGTVKDEDRGIERMLQYFSDFVTEDQLRQNMERYNLQKVFQVVKIYFEREYGYEGKEITLSNCYQGSINNYIYNDMENPAFVHMDELFESTVMSFLLAMFKWSKEFDDLEVYGNCFKYILFLMNEVCIFGEMQGQDANDALLQLLSRDMQILQLAEECYWTIVVFCLAHEIAHAYLAHTKKKYPKQHPEQEEFDADRIAYHIVLKIIMEGDNELLYLEKYTYLAPMMFMDFFDLYFYTDRVLYKTSFFDPEHPHLKYRKQCLFSIANKEVYDFDTSVGNDLYNAFLDVYDEFKDQILLKKERGKLDKIIHTEKRNQIRRKYYDQTRSTPV